MCGAFAICGQTICGALTICGQRICGALTICGQTMCDASTICGLSEPSGRRAALGKEKRLLLGICLPLGSQMRQGCPGRCAPRCSEAQDWPTSGDGRRAALLLLDCRALVHVLAREVADDVGDRRRVELHLGL